MLCDSEAVYIHIYVLLFCLTYFQSLYYYNITPAIFGWAHSTGSLFNPLSPLIPTNYIEKTRFNHFSHGWRLFLNTITKYEINLISLGRHGRNNCICILPFNPSEPEAVKWKKWMFFAVMLANTSNHHNKKKIRTTFTYSIAYPHTQQVFPKWMAVFFLCGSFFATWWYLDREARSVYHQVL